MRFKVLYSAVALLLPVCTIAHAETKTQMPVVEVSVFKDGHAFITRQGILPADSKGDIVIHELPVPVLGTFFPYSADKDVHIKSVTASKENISKQTTALSIRDLIEANPGAVVTVETNDSTTKSFDATILGMPKPEAKDNDNDHSTDDPPASSIVPQPMSSLVLLKTDKGTIAYPIDRIVSILFKEDFHNTKATDDKQATLSMRVDESGASKNVQVGMMYMQKGIIWRPSYKLVLDGKGDAHIQLQATISNDLIDLNDVTVNLVVGAPNFDFAGMTDPISLQKIVTQLASQINAYGRYYNGNMMQAQVISNNSYTTSFQDTSVNTDTTPEVSSGDKSDDLYVFPIKHLTLKKGQAIALQLADYHIQYKDVYTLKLPYVPVDEVRQYIDYNNRSQIKDLKTVKVDHKIRLINNSTIPLTTGPALVMKGDRLISQSTMTYGAAGAKLDLKLSPAINVSEKVKDLTVKNVPNAEKWNDYNYSRADIHGAVDITNYEPHDIDLEVSRDVFGHADTTDHAGIIELFDSLDSENEVLNSNASSWWDRINGYSCITWRLTMHSKEHLTLGYNWHYYYR